MGKGRSSPVRLTDPSNDLRPLLRPAGKLSDDGGVGRGSALPVAPATPSAFRDHCLSLPQAPSHAHIPSCSRLEPEADLMWAQSLCSTKGFSAPFKEQVQWGRGKSGGRSVQSARELLLPLQQLGCSWGRGARGWRVGEHLCREHAGTRERGGEKQALRAWGAPKGQLLPLPVPSAGVVLWLKQRAGSGDTGGEKPPVRPIPLSTEAGACPGHTGAPRRSSMRWGAGRGTGG